ncbi:MAG: hypothetical protein DHS20C15_03620 [Planctomycetota bacterium]|nr:MAG: hypothetical protein DHS20C15_03620 [Planctomycetota bacterium]
MAPKTPEPAPSRGPLVLGALVFVGVIVLAVRAHKEALQSPRFQVDPAQARVSARPSWLPEELAHSLAAHLSERLGEPLSLVDSDELRAWAPLLAEEAWVREVSSLEPVFPGRARVRLSLRRPVLKLDDGYLAADNGQILGSGQVEIEPEPLRLVGAAQEADRRACAQAAAELLPFRDQLSDWGVLIQEVESWGGGRVAFRDARGVVFDWGRPRSANAYAEVDLEPELKIENLLRALEAKPGLVGVGRVELWRAEPTLLPAGG